MTQVFSSKPNHENFVARFFAAPGQSKSIGNFEVDLRFFFWAPKIVNKNIKRPKVLEIVGSVMIFWGRTLSSPEVCSSVLQKRIKFGSHSSSGIENYQRAKRQFKYVLAAQMYCFFSFAFLSFCMIRFVSFSLSIVIFFCCSCEMFSERLLKIKEKTTRHGTGNVIFMACCSIVLYWGAPFAQWLYVWVWSSNDWRAEPLKKFCSLHGGNKTYIEQVTFVDGRISSNGAPPPK